MERGSKSDPALPPAVPVVDAELKCTLTYTPADPISSIVIKNPGTWTISSLVNLCDQSIDRCGTCMFVVTVTGSSHLLMTTEMPRSSPTKCCVQVISLQSLFALHPDASESAKSRHLSSAATGTEIFFLALGVRNGGFERE